MNRHATIASIALVLCASAGAADIQPAISDTIVAIRYQQLSDWRNRTILFRGDGTYQDLVREWSIIYLPPTSVPLEHGSYSFEVDSTDTVHGGQVYRGATITLDKSVELRLLFRTSTEGNMGDSRLNFTVYHRRLAESIRNVSNRSLVTPENPGISGFIVDGTEPRWVLLRAAGPGLIQFGVSVVVPTPRITLYSGPSRRGSSGSWSADPNRIDGLNAAFELVGAFPFPENSADSAMIALLMPGEYTLHVTTDSAAGEVLSEVYVLPFGN